MTLKTTDEWDLIQYRDWESNNAYKQKVDLWCVWCYYFRPPQSLKYVKHSQNCLKAAGESSVAWEAQNICEWDL